MKILSVLLFALSFSCSVWAQDDYGLYISVDFAPGEGKTDDFFVDTNTEINGGYQWRHGYSNVRLEGSYRWMRPSLDNPFDSFSGFVPISPDALKQFVRFEGFAEAQGPSGSLFYDFGLGDTGKNFFYLGSGFGLVDISAQYEAAVGPHSASLDDSKWRAITTFETGAVIRLFPLGIGRTGLQLGYQFAHINAAKLTTASGDLATVAFNNQHTLRVGLIHFFRRDRRRY